MTKERLCYLLYLLVIRSTSAETYTTTLLMMIYYVTIGQISRSDYDSLRHDLIDVMSVDYDDNYVLIVKLLDHLEDIYLDDSVNTKEAINCFIFKYFYGEFRNLVTEHKAGNATENLFDQLFEIYGIESKLSNVRQFTISTMNKYNEEGVEDDEE